MALTGWQRTAGLISEASTPGRRFTNFNFIPQKNTGLSRPHGLTAKSLEMSHARYIKSYTSLKILVNPGNSLKNTCTILPGVWPTTLWSRESRDCRRNVSSLHMIPLLQVIRMSRGGNGVPVSTSTTLMISLSQRSWHSITGIASLRLIITYS